MSAYPKAAGCNPAIPIFIECILVIATVGVNPATRFKIFAWSIMPATDIGLEM